MCTLHALQFIDLLLAKWIVSCYGITGIISNGHEHFDWDHCASSLLHNEK